MRERCGCQGMSCGEWQGRLTLQAWDWDLLSLSEVQGRAGTGRRGLSGEVGMAETYSFQFTVGPDEGGREEVKHRLTWPD